MNISTLFEEKIQSKWLMSLADNFSFFHFDAAAYTLYIRESPIYVDINNVKKQCV